ncbi:Nucleolar pre-ribosomal-associated protein 1 [Gryllus bimaculatus]|nr:Nucleolar pre-ribosomal-associated protein 1 [Gryllus bimaculatus]
MVVQVNNPYKRENGEISETIPIKKKRLEFCVSSFRKKLKKAECYEALEEFVKACHGAKGIDDPAAQYLKEGGQVMDILRILDSKHDHDISHVSVVFSALQVILLRVLTKAPECHKSAEEMCHHLLSSHLSSIHRLLSVKSSAHHKKEFFVSAVVTLNTTLARDVLSYITFSTDVVDNIVRLIRPDDPKSVRICFIQFLLAFLVEGNSSVISLLLDKRLILTSIIRGLMYDPFNLVIFVITTLRTKLVETSGINRTQKIHTFNTRVLCELLSLYKWKGPAAFAHEKKKSSAVCPEVDLQQQEAVAEAVHALFLVLCTSYRYGVVFHDRALGTKSRMNVMVANILKELDRPWENNLLTDLVVKIASVRPELSPISYSRVVPVLEPRATKPWTMAVSFVTRILSALKLNDLTSLEPQAALECAKKLAASRHVVIPLSPGLLHEHPVVRHKTTMFLQALLNAVGVSLTVLPEQQALEFQLYVKKIIPNVVGLIKSWRKALKNSIPEKSPPNIQVPSPTDQMMALVDLMFLYQKHFPLLLDAGDDHGTLTKMLSSTLDMDDNNENMLPLQLKILKLLAQLDTAVLEPQESGFIAAMSILLRASCNNDMIAAEAQQTLGALLVKCQVLEPVAADMIGEMGIWLQNCQAVQPSQRPIVISFLQNVLVSVATNPVPYHEQALRVQEMMFSSTELGKIRNTQLDQAEHLFQELLEIANIEKSYLQDFKKNVEESEGKNNKKIRIHDFAGTIALSPMLMYIDSVKLKENLDACVVKYLSSVLVHLLHLQSDPRPFLSIVKNWSDLPDAVMDYINSWSTETPLALTKPFGTCSLESSLSHALLGQSKNIPELEDCSNPIRILQLLRIVIFYIVQLAERQQLTETVTSLGLDVLIALFHALQEALSQYESSESEKFNIKCVNLILRHPVLLCYFSPLHRKKQITDSLVTSFMLSFLDQCTVVTSPAVAKNSSILLKDKLLRNILHYLERSKQAPTNTNMLVRAVKISALTGPEMCSLMPKLIQKMTTQPWKELICYLLRNVDCLPSEQVVSVGNKLVELLQEEHDTRLAAWEVVDSYQHYLQQFPHCVHQVPSGLFRKCVCERGLKLACVILQHQSSYVMELRTLVEQNNLLIGSPKVLFPLLSKASCHGPLPSSLLKAVYDQYEGNIFEAMQSPFSGTTWFSDHVDVIKLLISYMDLDKCISLSQLIAQNRKKIELCTPFHLHVMQSLQIQGGWKKLAVELTEMLLHQLKQMLEKKEPTPLISQLCTLLGDHLIDNRIKWRKRKLRSNETWDMLPMLVLQNGLSGLDQHLTCCLFSVFARLLWRANETKMAAQVFEMTVSHSRFLDVVLIQEHSDVKLAVLQLILTCYELAPQVRKASQVPIWLGSYGATLSHSDQVTLKILWCLNNCQDVNLNAYRPFLWGEAAINHYSVRSRAGMSLWRVPQATVALELLQLKMVENTISKFPLDRKLLLKQQENLFESDTFISGFIEDLEPNQPDVYDPAFAIPLLSHVLAPESVVQEHKFSRFGGLALTLSALASRCGYMRTAALSVLSRFHARLNPKSSNAQLNEQFIESIRAGIGNLKANEMCQATNPDPPKNMSGTCDKSTKVDKDNTSSRNDSNHQGALAPVVPNLFAVFLARTSLVLTQPLHELFKPLNRYVLAKPALDLKTVPDLLELLRPDSVDFRAYQLWLIETLQFGMRTEDDVVNAKRRHLFKMLFALYSSSLSDVRTRILVLLLVEATLCVSNGSTVLLKSGILPWLHGIINSLQKEEDGDVIIAFIRVMVALKNHALSFGSMVVPFLLKLPPIVKSSDIHCILQAGITLIKWLSKDHLVVLLCLCERMLDHKIIDECCAQLGLPEGTTIKNEELLDHSDTSGRDLVISVEERKALGDTLKKVVHQWLTYKYDVKA